MLAYRLRRRPDNKPALVHRLLFDGTCFAVFHYFLGRILSSFFNLIESDPSAHIQSNRTFSVQVEHAF